MTDQQHHAGCEGELLLSPDAEGIVSLSDAATIGLQIAEMADRVKAMHAVIPGAQATLGFEMDGVRFQIAVSVQEEPSHDTE